MTRSWRDILAPCLAAESRRTARRSAGRLDQVSSYVPASQKVARQAGDGTTPRALLRRRELRAAVLQEGGGEGCRVLVQESSSRLTTDFSSILTSARARQKRW